MVGTRLRNLVHVCVCAVSVVAPGVAATAAPGDSQALSAPQSAVCTMIGGRRVVDQSLLANWLDITNTLSIGATVDPNTPGHRFGVIDVFTDSAVRARFEKALNDEYVVEGKSAKDAGKAVADVDSAIVGEPHSIYLMAKPHEDSNRLYYGADGFDATAWLRQPSPVGVQEIDCAKPPPQVAGTEPDSKGGSGAEAGKSAVSLDQIRVRGTPDSLVVDRSQKSFANADKATVSYAHDGIKNTRTNVFQATVGYELFPAKDDTSVVPYVAVNQNVTDTKGKPAKKSVHYYDIGVAVGRVSIDDSPDIGPSELNIFSATPHYLANDLDDSRLFGLHLQDTPKVFGLLNDYNQFHQTDKQRFAELALLFDFRADADVFTDRGTAPQTNKDYVRLGSRFGAEVLLLQGSPLQSDISVTDTWMYGIEGTLRRLNDLQASWTTYFDADKKYFGLSLTYKNGRIEATGQPEQTWMVSLTGKY